VLRDRTLARALRGSLKKLRLELLSHEPRQEDYLRAADRIAAELGLRSPRRGRSRHAPQVDAPRPRTGTLPKAQDFGSEPLDAVLTAIANIPLRTAWEWFRQGMQLANTLSSPERGRAATAAGKSLAKDTVTALARFSARGDSPWVLGAEVVADLESRLGALALRDTRESCDPLTPLDVGQAILEAIGGRGARPLECSALSGPEEAQGMQVFPVSDEKCLRCGHDPESCYGGSIDEDA